ncbi:MAG: STAS domain-containing protein [Candidatus Nanopelagicales bacterium]
MDLVLTTRQEDAATVVAAAGEIDVFTAPDLDSALTAAVADGSGRILVDLSEVSFLDSTGLGTLVKCLKHANAAGGWLRLVVGTEKIRKIFDITGLDAAMPMYDTVEAALAN